MDIYLPLTTKRSNMLLNLVSGILLTHHRVLSQPEVTGGQRTLFYSGDDAEAKAEVRKLLESTGFFPVDLGNLDVGGPLMQLPFGALAMSNFIKV